MEQYSAVIRRPSAVWVNSSMMQLRIDSQYYKTDYVENEYKIEQLGYERLGEIIERGDYGILPDSEDYGDIGVPLIRGTDLRNLTIEIKELIKVPKKYIGEKSQLQHEDILILIKGATIDDEWSVSIVPKISEKMIFNGSIFRIRLKSKYNPYFIVVFMGTKYFLLQKTRAISNTGIYYNDKNSLENFLIPIPSPEIQKYIGDKVRRAEELREEAKKLKEEAEEILSAALNIKELEKNIENTNLKYNWIGSKIIEDRIDSTSYNPIVLQIKDFYKNYNKEKLKDIASYKKGYAFKSDDYIADHSGVYMLRVTDINGEQIDYDSMIRLPHRYYEEFKQFSLEHEDIVMVVTGNTTGKSVIIYNERGEKILLNQNAIRLRIKDKYDSYYVDMLIKSKYFQNLLKYSLYQSVQPFISLEFLNKVEIPIIDDDLVEKISKLYSQNLSNLYLSKQLIQEAKQDVEDLIEGNFDMSKLNKTE